MKLTINGQAYEFANGMNALDIAGEIDKDLKKNALVARINGRTISLPEAINEDGVLEIVGFENHGGTIDRDEKIILDGNFILTYTIGPLLVRNPKLTDYIIKKLLSSINSSCNPEKADYTFEEKAYETSQKTDLKNISST